MLCGGLGGAWGVPTQLSPSLAMFRLAVFRAHSSNARQDANAVLRDQDVPWTTSWPSRPRSLSHPRERRRLRPFSSRAPSLRSRTKPRGEACRARGNRPVARGSSPRTETARMVRPRRADVNRATSRDAPSTDPALRSMASRSWPAASGRLQHESSSSSRWRCFNGHHDEKMQTHDAVPRDPSRECRRLSPSSPVLGIEGDSCWASIIGEGLPMHWCRAPPKG